MTQLKIVLLIKKNGNVLDSQSSLNFTGLTWPLHSKTSLSKNG